MAGLKDFLTRGSKPEDSPGVPASDEWVVRQVPNDVPRNFVPPLDVTISADIDTDRVVFVATVRDADGAPVPDLHMQCHITGPARAGSGETHTDLRGRATFRMSDGPGSYACTLESIAGGAVDVHGDRTAEQILP